MIAAGLPNEGIYRWRLPSIVPPLVYLRLEAEDRAGNVGLYDSPTPLNLTMANPAPRLLGLTPAEMPLAK